MDVAELDWPVEQPVLGQLEQSLRCKICHDLFTGPVTLPCGHSYCSQCIRSNFDFKIREGHKVACPECRASLDPADLRPSLALRDVCALLTTCKPLLLQALHAQKLQQSAPSLQQQAVQQHNRLTQQQQQQQQQQSSRCLTRRLSIELQQQQEQQQQLRNGYDTADAGPSTSSRPHSDPLALHRTRTRRSSRTQLRASSSPPGLQAAATADPSDEEEGEFGSEDSEEEGSDADSEFTPSPVAKRRRTGDLGGKENVATTHHLPEQQQSAAAHQQQRQRLSNGSSGDGAAEAAAAVKSAKPARPDYGECPVCGITVHLKFIETHVNDCLTKPQQTKQQQQPEQPTLEDEFAAPRARQGSRAAGPRASAPAAHSGRVVKACTLPPKLCFNMMNIREVKDRLVALGLPVDAKPKLTKEAMVQRYQAFRTFVQSLPDSGRVLTQEQAVAEFSNKLRRQQRAAAQQQLLPPTAAAAAAGNNSFDELIKQTRARQQQQQAAPMEQQQQQQQQPQHGHGTDVGAAGQHSMAVSVPAGSQQQQRLHSNTADANVARGGAYHAVDGLSTGHEAGSEGGEHDERAQAPATGAVDQGRSAGQQQQQQWLSGSMHTCAFQQALVRGQQHEHPIIIEDSEPDD